jgi:hypothetical protein
MKSTERHCREYVRRGPQAMKRTERGRGEYVQAGAWAITEPSPIAANKCDARLSR